VLRPEGRLAALVWSSPERNPLFARYIDFVAKHLDPGAMWSDPFSLADVALFAEMLEAAGGRQVQVRTIPLIFHFSLV
jgi:hypothetical protein